MQGDMASLLSLYTENGLHHNNEGTSPQPQAIGN